MNVLILLITATFTIRYLHKLLFLIRLWRVKEYRFDRMRIHLTTKQGSSLLVSRSNAALILTILLYLAGVPRIFFAVVVALVYLVFALRILLGGKGVWRFPPASPKTVVLGSLVTFSSLWVIFGARSFFPATLPIIDLLLFPMLSEWVLALKAPTFLYHRSMMALATRKLRRHAPIVVIGITGSIGKTSAKDYLATILGTKYRVLATEGSKNSAIAVAERIVGKLQPDHEVLIVEMGAYKRGEIAGMCAMVRPEIGIITFINEEHLDLFGSLENTMQAKYELIQGLTGQRIAILNADNTHTRALTHRALRDAREVWVYTREKRNPPGGANVLRAQDIDVGTDGISFTIAEGKRKEAVTAAVLGAHQVGNILASVAGALACGMSLADACRAVSKITPSDKTMQEVVGPKGVRFINDTFNNNPEAAKAAISFLRSLTGRKILIFQPMVELGPYAATAHRDVGVLAATVCDDIILTNSNFSEYFLAGVRSVDPDKNVQILDPDACARFVRSTAKKGDTVLFKGKESEMALRLLVREEAKSRTL